MRIPKLDQGMHAANKARWEAGAELWSKRTESRGLWKRAPLEPELVLSPMELQYLRDLAGRRVCVLGSGDNQVVFALAGLGGAVTSVDISEGQLASARERAEKLGLAIEFVQSDVTNLWKLKDASYDVVYTGGHVACWVSDLERYYSEAARILRPGGLFVVCEYHPFRRVWKESYVVLAVQYPYFDRGPFEYEASSDVLAGAKPGAYKTYEFHWTVADFLNATLKAGCTVVRVDEFGDGHEGWENAEVGGLPESLLIVARKNMGKNQSEVPA
jgi:ubiquinone/menaquinone biosynthesis C-methylase UbiE